MRDSLSWATLLAVESGSILIVAEAANGWRFRDGLTEIRILALSSI